MAFGCEATCSPVIDADGVTRLATLPSREVLLSQLAGAFAAPLATTAGLFDAPLREIAGLAQNAAQRKMLADLVSKLDKNDIVMLQDLVIAAVNEAHRRAQEEIQKEMSSLMGGMSVPGMF